MAKNGFKVLDSDMHIMEPPDLWQRYIDPEFRDQAPHILRLTPGGNSIMVGPDGKQWGRDTSYRNTEQRRSDGDLFPEHKRRVKPFEEIGWTAEAQLNAMDQEGIDVAVLYPTHGLYALAVRDMGPRLASAVARGYNNWLYDFCQANPSRLIGAGIISPFDVEDSVIEARRCVKELGFKGFFMRPNEVKNRNWHDPYYEPLWAALEELDTPIGFHEATGCDLPEVGENFGNNIMLRHTFSHPVEQMMVAASFCGGGVLERHPGLRAAFLEANCSWLPFFLWRLDEHWELFGSSHAPDLTMAPSEYFKRQCYASVEPDEVPVKYVVDYMGSDRLVFSTDFPHLDSKFPDSVEGFLELPISDEDKRRILWDNCAKYYGIK